MQGQIKAIAITIRTHALQAFRHSIRVTIFTTGTDLRTACDRIPGCISPFYVRVISHYEKSFVGVWSPHLIQSIYPIVGARSPRPYNVSRVYSPYSFHTRYPDSYSAMYLTMLSSKPCSSFSMRSNSSIGIS